MAGSLAQLPPGCSESQYPASRPVGSRLPRGGGTIGGSVGADPPIGLALVTLALTIESVQLPMLLPEDRSFAAAVAGPVLLMMSGSDWTGHNRDFTLSVEPRARHAVPSIAFDVRTPGLQWRAKPTRFHIGESNGVQDSDVTRTPTGPVWTLQFVPNSFSAGGRFTFGMSVFAPLQGSTPEDPDRFGGMTMTVTLDNGNKYTGTVLAGEPESPNSVTRAGLVNAATATNFHH